MPQLQDKITMHFTKEQLEEMYQWYLIMKDEFNLKDFEIEAGEKIKNKLIELFGEFN